MKKPKNLSCVLANNVEISWLDSLPNILNRTLVEDADDSSAQLSKPMRAELLVIGLVTPLVALQMARERLPIS